MTAPTKPNVYLRTEIKLRVSNSLRQRLMKVARAEGRSLNKECEARLLASLPVLPTPALAPALAKPTAPEPREMASRRPASPLRGDLSETQIDKLVAAAKAGKPVKVWHSDGGNLMLKIVGAAVSWVFRYDASRFGGASNVNMGLGSYPAIDLYAARERALELKRMLADGKDPRAARAEAKLKDHIARGLEKTVNEVVAEYLVIKERKSESFQSQAKYWFDTYVRDQIGSWPIQKVTTNNILEDAGLKDLWTRQNPTAKGFQNHLSQMFDLAIARGWFIGKNPAAWATLKHALAPSADVHQTKHHDALPYRDASRFMEKLRAYKDKGIARPNIRTTVSLAIEMLALTGVRLGEVQKAQWKEIDFDRRAWIVPWQHLKTGRKTRKDRPVPITSAMRVVLDEMLRRYPNPSPDAFVFPGQWSASRMLNRANLTNFINLQLGWETHVTVHGFRSTLRDWRAEQTQFPDILWKFQVDHAVAENLSDGSYGSTTLLEKRREMMEAWGSYCAAPTPEPASVTVLADKRRKANARH